MITRAEQRKIWEEEHRHPQVLPVMDSTQASSGVVSFFAWLKRHATTDQMTGAELCCGKGRNCFYLASQGIRMTGLDFSTSAIETAIERSRSSGFQEGTTFVVADVTKPYFEDGSLDLIIDCFGLTDIESPAGRKSAKDHCLAALKPGGFLFAYASSSECAYHAAMIAASPGKELGTFLHPLSGKFEKCYVRHEFIDFYAPLGLRELRCIEQRQIFQGTAYDCRNWWAVFQKP